MAAEIAPAEHRAQKIQYQCCKRYPNSPQLYTETVIFEQKAFQQRHVGMPYDANFDANFDASSAVACPHHAHPALTPRSATASAQQAGQ
ncbi:hypothetical protein AKG95_04315 [Janthinobacterium lividum]|uniref:Uncharacterized protein n=1 Tax=Janthinobacterium lividum TaxID=29581 RepID=A0A1S1UH11_9BURK|nr:hypothetical protein AKG95_04315 [Janthinobacterium lividum]